MGIEENGVKRFTNRGVLREHQRYDRGMLCLPVELPMVALLSGLEHDAKGEARQFYLCVLLGPI